MLKHASGTPLWSVCSATIFEYVMLWRSNTHVACGHTFEYIYKWWRGNCENLPLPTIGSVFQCMKVDLPSCVDVCACAYVLKWCSALFLLKKVNTATLAHWNYCSALSMVVPPCCSERYTNCLSIIYMFTQKAIHRVRCLESEIPKRIDNKYW